MNPRMSTEVVVTYTGDAQDHMSVSLLFSRPRLVCAGRTVWLVLNAKSNPQLEDAAHMLRNIVETGLIRDENNDDDAVHDLWNALVPTR